MSGHVEASNWLELWNPMTLFSIRSTTVSRLSLLNQQEIMARNVLFVPGSVPAFRVLAFILLLLPLHAIAARHDYRDALRKSILFFEGQRSGKLPPDQRVRWRKDSALHDGATAGVMLTSHIPMPPSAYPFNFSCLAHRKR